MEKSGDARQGHARDRAAGFEAGDRGLRHPSGGRQLDLTPAALLMQPAISLGRARLDFGCVVSEPVTRITSKRGHAPRAPESAL
jgi:hypothetical protein